MAEDIVLHFGKNKILKIFKCALMYIFMWIFCPAILYPQSEAIENDTVQDFSFSIGFLTYWQPNLTISNEILLAGIPVKFFSRRFTPRSGFVFHGRGPIDSGKTKFGEIGTDVSIGYSISDGIIHWHSPDLGISYTPITALMHLVEIGGGMYFAPYSLDIFPIRPYIFGNIGWLGTILTIQIDGKWVEHEKAERTDGHWLLKYGAGLDILLFGLGKNRIGLAIRYDRYSLKRSSHIPEPGITIEGHYNNPYQISIGLIFYGKVFPL